MRVDDIYLPSVPDDFVDAQSAWDAEVVDKVYVHARPAIQGGPLLPVAYVCFLVRGIYRGAYKRVVALKALHLESEDLGDPVRPVCHREFLESGGVVLGVCDRWVVEVEEFDGGFGGREPGL